MKYAKEKNVSAIYDNDGSGNPLLEAMPEQMERTAFERAMTSHPQILLNNSEMSFSQRKRSIVEISSLFVPLNYMYAVYDTLYRLMQSTYLTQTAKENVQRINQIFMNNGTAFSTQAETASLLGTPGIGKSSCVRRCLYQIPQVICHERYHGEPFYCKQILYLSVECPSDCSIKTLAYNIVQALDLAVGTNHLDYMMNRRSAATSTTTTYLKTLCLTYHVGIIVIDEIQNAVETARKDNRVRPLIRFLVELTNDTNTSIYFVGTTAAESVFTAEEHLRRRTRGLRLIPFKPDGAYRQFLSELWQYQYTRENAPMSQQMANKLYDLSGGIPDYVVKLFREAQLQAISHRKEKIDAAMIQQAAAVLSIKPPKQFDAGISLSDFDCDDTPCPEMEESDEPIKRSYAQKRGRKVTKRDEQDLLAWFRNKNLPEQLGANHMVEVCPKC